MLVPLAAPPDRLSASPVPVEIDNGVIEEARRRRRRRRLAASGVLGGLGLVGGLLALVGGGGSSRRGAEFASSAPLKLALVHGRAFLGGHPALVGVTPSLQAGNVGGRGRVGRHGGGGGEAT